MSNESNPTGPAEPAGAPPEPRLGTGRRPERLHRSRRGRIIAGVADGLADYFDVDTTLVRVAFVVLALVGGVAVPLYLAGWLLIPEEGSDRSVAEELLGRHPAL
jgi:phage shock protein PspC (stress-responsive transcriptional regulator)